MTTNVTAAAGGAFPLGGDLRVNRMGFGAMRLAVADRHGPTRDPRTGVAVLRRAVELGVNHLDTAGFYGRDQVHAHELIAEALHPYPEELVIATKVGPLRDGNGMPTGEARPDELRDLVHDDLRRLRVDRLDLVYLRVGNRFVPDGESIADRFAVLAEMREEGLIRHLALSNVDAAQWAEARSIAPVVAVQNNFHLQNQDDTELLTTCAEEGIAYVPYFPLGGGDRALDLDRLDAVAARHRATSAQVALAWLLARSPAVLVIPGTGSLAHLEENVAAAGLHLTDQDVHELG